MARARTKVQTLDPESGLVLAQRPAAGVAVGEAGDPRGWME